MKQGTGDWTHVSIKSGEIHDVRTFHRVSGLTSILLATRSGNHSPVATDGLSSCSEALSAAETGLEGAIDFCHSPGKGADARSKSTSNNGRPEVSPCHLLQPCSSKYIYDCEREGLDTVVSESRSEALGPNTELKETGMLEGEK